jgi:hypothetical protein
MKEFATAFIKAKRAFGPAFKDKNNPHFKSKYADLASCIEAVDDALLDNGIAMYQETFQDDTGITIETVFMHESGQTMRCGKLHVPAAKHDPQGFGSALTYARRYSVMTACGIAPEDDDGNAGTRTAYQQNPAQAKQAAEVGAAIRAIQVCKTVDELKVAYGAAMTAFGAEFGDMINNATKACKSAIKAAQ